MTLKISAGAPHDAARLHVLNQQAEPGVGAVSQPELEALIAQSWRTFVAAEGADRLGFLLVLAPGLAYESLNYGWFSRRGGAFLYIDRIAVAARARGHGVGAALYAALIDAAPPRTALACEVNLVPPNPGSMRFHHRLGFREIGRAAHEPGVKEVAFLERAPRD